MALKRIFSTSGIKSKDRFSHWRGVCEDQLVPMEQSCFGDQPFGASIYADTIGGLSFTQFELSNLKASTTPKSIRHRNNKTDQLFVSMVMSGSVNSEQNGRSITDRAGDITIRDTNSPWTIEHRGYSDVVAIEIPRDRLEGLLGSARHFAGLTMSGNLPVTTLARSFLCNLLAIGDQLTPHAAERMTTVAIDLVAASLVERLAMETPKPLSGTLIVQRAKAYGAANLGNPDLDASQLAAAVGVSLRQLQVLFQDRGANITAWIWQQRIELAARRLSDPAYLHLQLGELAYCCGFASQSHFSRRFRERYGLSPRAYRHTALSQAAALEV